jgi:hypothetical protein
VEHLNVKSSTIGLVNFLNSFFAFFMFIFSSSSFNFGQFVFFPNFHLSKFVIYVYARTLEIDIII